MAYENVINALIQTESGGDPMARNSRSSAGGAGQFINSTWLSLVKKYRPDVAEGKSDAQLLQLKFDPNLAKEMVQRYAEENTDFLSKRGFDATPGNIKLAHFSGPSGAASVLADPNETVKATLGDAAVQANPFMRDYTNADLASWADRSMNKAGGGDEMANVVRARFGQPDERSEFVGEVGPSVQESDKSVVDKILSALGGQVQDEVSSLDSYDANRLGRAETLIGNAQNIGGRGDIAAAIGGPILAALGGYQRDQELERQKAANQSFVSKISENVQVPPMIDAMLNSGNPEYQQAGIQALMKLQGQTKTDVYGREFPALPPRTSAAQPQASTPDPYGSQPQQPFMATARPPVDYASSEPQQNQASRQTVQTVASPQPQPGPQVAGGPIIQRQGKQDAMTPEVISAMSQPQGKQSPAIREAVMQEAQASIPQGFKIGPPVPKVPDGYIQKLAPGGVGYLFDAMNEPVFELKSVAEARAKNAPKLADREQGEAIISNQVTGDLSQLSKTINDATPDEWNLAAGQYGGSDSALYEDPMSYVLGSAKRSAVALGEELFGTARPGRSAQRLRQELNSAGADLVLTYRAIQKQRGVTDSQQSNADLAFLKSVVGNLPTSNSREEAFAILNSQVRPIFARILGKEIPPLDFRRWEKIDVDQTVAKARN